MSRPPRSPHLIRIRPRFYQRKANHLKSKGEFWAAAQAESRSELLFRKLRRRA